MPSRSRSKYLGALVVGKRLSDLLSDPECAGMRRHVEVHEPSAVMAQDNEAEQDTEGDRRDGEEVDSGDLSGVILQEAGPTLRRWFRPTDHVSRHSGFSDIVAEQGQLGLDSRGTPTDLLHRDVPDELADFGIDLGAPNISCSQFPSPVVSGALPMPPDDSIGFDDDQGRCPVLPEAGDPDPDGAVTLAKTRPLDRALQDCHLPAKGKILGGEPNAV